MFNLINLTSLSNLIVATLILGGAVVSDTIKVKPTIRLESMEDISGFRFIITHISYYNVSLIKGT